MGDVDPAKPQSGGPGLRWRECVEVEDAREDLRREDGDWNERVAAREHRENRSVDALVDCGEGCSACLGGLDGRLELVQLGFEAGEHVGERSGRLSVARHEEFGHQLAGI